MALPRLDYQRPDYAGGIGAALGGAAKTVNDWSPASAPIQKYLRAHLNDGMDPREAAIMAKLEMGGHIGGDNSAPQGQQLTGGNTTFQGPSPQAPMGRVNSPAQMPMPASQPQVGGGFTGKREFTGPEETVTAPRQMGSRPPDLSALDQAPQDNSPILNRDVPQLMQVAAQNQKHDPADTYMKLYALGLRGDALNEKVREFEGMAPVRQSMINQRDAGISNMPLKNQQAQGNLNARWAGVGVAQGNLAERQNVDYMKETKETAQAIPAFDQILRTIKYNPSVAPDTWDYATRKAGRILGGLPMIGNTFKESMETVADSALNDQQRQLRTQIAQAMGPYRKLTVGTQITPGEFQLIDQISGQQFSIRDTIAALTALRMSLAARHQRAKAAFPAAAGRIPDSTPDQVLPRIQDPTGAEGLENLAPPPANDGFVRDGPVPLIGDQ